MAGSPDYFARHGTPATPADLIGHNCLCYRHTTSGAIYRWEFTSSEVEGHAFEVEPQGSMVTNDDNGMIRAALQGIGLIQHQDIALREHLDAGTLVRVLAPWCKPFPGYYLYTPSHEQMPAKVRALMDFLVEKRERLAANTATLAAAAAASAASAPRKPRARRA
ncbi:LysR substrate-binding domain-containing protein [Burkholderia pseudomultivorans]|uniref:LysR substrate-binding domain-containing protein n=1 Tax=Burkholderia pseudomultivorans TaxID=1207504 RepID=UPI001E573B6C|nr:LysR substrate-binding domain-containing protein [Burkholderia pseudomultivorans]